MKTLKQIANWICLIFAILVAAIFIFSVLYFRFTNIDMSETRLLVTYWRPLLGMIGVFSIFVLGYEATKKK